MSGTPQSGDRSHAGWLIGGGITVAVILTVCSILMGVAAWLPVAYERDGAQGGEEAPPPSGVLAPDAVPPEYRALVEEWGSHCPTLTPPRLAAQLQQESGWRPDAESPVGARGIAQFMPGTWATHGMDANGDGEANVWDPRDAIPSAAAYDCAIARQVRDVPGDAVDNMLAAYNAGPGAVLRYGGIPPYEETRHYVRTIRDLEATLAASMERVVEAAPSAQGARIVHYARQEIGMPYLWGGDGPPAGEAGWDCSGLTLHAVSQATNGQVTIPRISSQQRTVGVSVPPDQMRPGDLIVINNDGAWGHVGVYSGNGHIVHAPRPGRTVEEVPLAGYWDQFEWDIRRVA